MDREHGTKPLKPPNLSIGGVTMMTCHPDYPRTYIAPLGESVGDWSKHLS